MCPTLRLGHISVKYISKMLSTYEHMFPGETLNKQSSFILKGYHPDRDDSG